MLICPCGKIDLPSGNRPKCLCMKAWPTCTLQRLPSITLASLGQCAELDPCPCWNLPFLTFDIGNLVSGIRIYFMYRLAEKRDVSWTGVGQYVMILAPISNLVLIIFALVWPLRIRMWGPPTARPEMREIRSHCISTKKNTGDIFEGKLSNMCRNYYHLRVKWKEKQLK